MRLLADYIIICNFILIQAYGNTRENYYQKIREKYINMIVIISDEIKFQIRYFNSSMTTNCFNINNDKKR